MAKFYYNGVLLPEIPQDVLAEYPYVVIVRTFSLSTTRFFAKKSPYYYNYSDYKVVSPEVGGQLCTLSNDGESWSSGTTLTGETSLINNPTAWELVWTTHDIPFDSVTSTNIYFHSSNPIPENAEYWQIESGTLISFGDQARRINGTTLPLTTSQMLEIFEGAGQGGSLEGLENGYDVMFYDENNEGLAFYSIRQGDGINAPIYGSDSWRDESGNTIVFPYTPTSDISIYALAQSYASRLYNLYNVDQETYPYVLIFLNKDNSNLTMLIFAKGIANDGTTSIRTTSEPLYGQAYNVEISDINAENLVNAVISSITSVSEYFSFLEIYSNTNKYVAVNYETKANNAIRLD